MKRTTQIAAAALVAVMAISGLSVLAAEEQAAPVENKERPAFAGMHHKGNFKGWGQNRQGWARKELTEEEKAAQKAARIEKAKVALAAQLEAGKITQEQYNERLAKIEAGDFGFQFKGRDNAEQRKERKETEKPQRKELTEEEKAAQKAKRENTFKAVLDAQLKSGKITQEQYDDMLAKREAGQATPWSKGRDNAEKPQRKELTEEEKAAQKAARIEAAKKALAAQLEAGKITQEQYDERLAKIEAGDFGFQFNGWGNNNRFQGKKPQWNRNNKKWEGKGNNGKPGFGGFQRGWNKGAPKADATAPATT